MEHSLIEEHNLIDRYVRGTMPVAERTIFEEHFLDCPDCLQQLEVARSLRESIQIAGAEMASLTAPAGATSESSSGVWHCQRSQL
jgi:anti-sigma factor RsiW